MVTRRAGAAAALERAFTLIEVIIGLTILAMITGTLFAIIKGAVSGAADIERVQRETDSINRFVELCRMVFQTLPGSATLALKIVDQTDPPMQELTITGAPHAFGFGTSPTSYKETILTARSDTDQPASVDTNAPRYIISISRADLIPQTDSNQISSQSVNSVTAPDDQGRYWMPLLSGVASMSWKFYKLSDDSWVDEWSSTKWPDLIELDLTMEGHTQPLRCVFSVPVLSLRSATGRSSSGATPAAGSGGSPTGAGGGGAPAGGGGGGAPPTGGGGR